MAPLAEKMRPRRLQDFVGQAHLLAEGGLLRRAVENGRLFSMILWGPPGSGKTTLARIVAQEADANFETFSAVLSGVKEIREVVARAGIAHKSDNRRTILFVDEIHRFNKAQQDAFLPHVESGLITLVGATTENPSFEVIAPLLSRCRVMVLKPFSQQDLMTIISRALTDKQRGLGDTGLDADSAAIEYLAAASDGDARVALNNLEAAAAVALKVGEEGGQSDSRVNAITLDAAQKAIERKALLYDKSGEEHYNLISALHKSLRGSDPNASLYWLGRMLEAGEDPLYIARRMIRFASEDIGNAEPNALTVAMAAMQAFHFIGLPEGELALAQAAVYLATAPKSNALYTGYGKVKQTIKETGPLPVPLHIRNAPTKLMKGLGYGQGYKYAHDYENAQVKQECMPKGLEGKLFYVPTDRGYERTIKQRLEYWERLRRARK